MSSTPGPLTNPAATYDSAGVTMYARDGRLYDHPVVQAQYMLTRLSSFRHNQDQAYLLRVVAHAERLMERSVAAREARYLPYPFDFPLHGRGDDLMVAPWYSAMAQGQALSAFTRLYQVTRQARYLRFAEELFASLRNLRAGGDPWVVDLDQEGYLWFEEYAKHPGADRTFNGHLFTIFGLYDYWWLARDPATLRLLRGGLTAADRRGGQIRVVGGASLYCLTHRVPSAKYHAVHVRQLYTLYSMTGSQRFSQLADALLSDHPAVRSGGAGIVAPGDRLGLALDAGGRVTGTRTFRLERAEEATFGGRGKASGYPGVWLRAESGTAAGYWIAEHPDSAYVAGFIEGYGFHPVRQLAVASGSYEAYRFDAGGRRTASRRDTLPRASLAHVDRRVVANGRPHVHVVDGFWAGWWVPIQPGATLR
jgi:hypothetical protein